ncbi:MAG: hypothetical protein NW226_20690, partial [Microscillaceae bacterium]|nr:hypothetical protein [Microscillaceae bacterium]
MGPWKRVPLSKGDKVSIKVQARSQTTSRTGTPPGLSLFLQANPGYSDVTDSDGNTLQNNSSLVSNLRVGLGYVPSSQPQSGEIKAYLQYLFYDQNNRYIGQAKKYVNSSIAGQSSGVGQSLGFENSQAFTAPENGYIEIFVANEGNEDVWFDDL